MTRLLATNSCRTLLDTAPKQFGQLQRRSRVAPDALLLLRRSCSRCAAFPEALLLPRHGCCWCAAAHDALLLLVLRLLVNDFSSACAATHSRQAPCAATHPRTNLRVCASTMVAVVLTRGFVLSVTRWTLANQFRYFEAFWHFELYSLFFSTHR